MVTTLSGKPLSKIGIGSYGIGGKGHRGMDITEQQADQVYIDAVVYSLNHGSNFTELSLGYGHGRSLALFKKALDASTLQREDVFITHSIYPQDVKNMQDIQADTEAFLNSMQYADSTLVTQSLLIEYGEEAILTYLHELLESGKTRYVSLSNAGLKHISRFKEAFGNAFFAHEGHLSFEVRANQDKGIFDLCNDLNVENIIWRPLRRKATLEHNWPLLKELAVKYHKTESQIILNWITHLGYRPMVFSTNTRHIDENLAATAFVMEANDYIAVSNARVGDPDSRSVDWDGQHIDNDLLRLVATA